MEKLLRVLPYPRGLRYGSGLAALFAGGLTMFLFQEATRPRDPGQTTFPCSEIEAHIKNISQRPADDFSPDRESVQIRCRFISEAVPLMRSEARCERRQYLAPDGTWENIDIRLDATIEKHRHECSW